MLFYSLSRLVREDNKALNKTTTFSYDAGGNILNKTEYPFNIVHNLNFENGIRADGIVGFNLNGTEYVYKKNILGGILGILNISGKEIKIDCYII